MSQPYLPTNSLRVARQINASEYPSSRYNPSDIHPERLQTLRSGTVDLIPHFTPSHTFIDEDALPLYLEARRSKTSSYSKVDSFPYLPLLPYLPKISILKPLTSYQSTLNTDLPPLEYLVPGSIIPVNIVATYPSFPVPTDLRGEDVPVEIILPVGAAAVPNRVNLLLGGSLYVFKNEGNRIILLYQPLYSPLLSKIPSELTERERIILQPLLQESEKLFQRTGIKTSPEIVTGDYLILALINNYLLVDDRKGEELLNLFCCPPEGKSLSKYLIEKSIPQWTWKDNYLYRLK